MKRNLKLIAWFNFFLKLKFYSPILVLYFIDITGSYALGLSILAVDNITVLITEIPTGILSDKIGRRKTIILGAFAQMVAVFCYALSSESHIYLAFLGSALFGLSSAFLSGNNSAILYETLQSLDKTDQLHLYNGKNMGAMRQLGLFIATVIGGFLAYFNGYNFVMCVSVIPSIICFIISCIIVETMPENSASNKALTHLKESIRLLVANKNNIKLFITSLLNSLFMAAHRLEVVFAEAFLSLWEIGIFKGSVHLMIAISFALSGKIIDKIGYKRASIEGNIIFSVIQIIAYLIGTIFAPVLIVLSYFFKGIEKNSEKTLIQHALSNKERATMGSILSMTESLITALMLVLVGLLADKIGVAYAAIAFISIRLIIAIPLLTSYFKNE